MNSENTSDKDQAQALNKTDVSGSLLPKEEMRELLIDFVCWQNRCSKWVKIPEGMVDDYLKWKKFSPTQ